MFYASCDLRVLAAYAARLFPENIFLFTPLVRRMINHSGTECAFVALLAAEARASPEAKRRIDDETRLHSLALFGGGEARSLACSSIHAA